jgi:hypothetical protein
MLPQRSEKSVLAEVKWLYNTSTVQRCDADVRTVE